MRQEPLVSPLQARPYMLADEGPSASAVEGLDVRLKASTGQTGGAFNLFTLAAPAGFATPLHIHYAEDVAVFVLEGSLTIFWGDEAKEAPAGSYSFMPKGTPHGFRVTHGAGARILYLTVPGGVDAFTQEPGFMKESAGCLAAAARYKIEILGPLPDDLSAESSHLSDKGVLKGD